jgi:hypothetical protein
LVLACHDGKIDYQNNYRKMKRKNTRIKAKSFSIGIDLDSAAFMKAFFLRILPDPVEKILRDR